MKIILFLILFILFFSQSVIAAKIEVKVPKDVEGKISSFTYNSSLNLLKFQIEFYNIGSIAYKTRIRIDIFNDSQWLFTGWSVEKSLMPGERKNFEIYWYTNLTNNFTANVRSYFANEISEQKYNVEKNASILPQSVFEIKNFRAYDDYIIFDIVAKENSRDVIVIPSDFPFGWIFEQKKIDFINKDVRKTVVLQYQPTVWLPENLKLAIVSDEGRYYTGGNFELRKETGILWFVFYVIDKLRIILP